MPTHRLTTALFAALVGAAALAGCKKKEEPAPMPPVTSEPAPATPAPMPSAAAVTVTGVDLGNAVGADMRVTSPMDVFSPNDTIYAAVATATSDPAGSVPGTVGVRWTHVDSGQVVHEESQDLTLSGDGITDFQISKPDGWPAGKYKLEVMLDGKLVQTREFQVK